MTRLVFDRVGKTYAGGAVAVANVSITLADGEFVVLVGPSGCGKSTLLRMAAGLEQLTDGRLLIGDQDVSRAPPQQRDIAMVFQNYALYPHMTVYENIAFGLQQRKTAKAEIARRVTEVARTLDLTPYLQRKPGALSGGQRQRVAMGRAIVREPAAFLMDEPLSNLDAKLRVQMRAELKLLNERLGVTTLYVTHDQVEAMTMGDRVAVLKPIRSATESNLQQIDTPQALYDRPANLFVASFIGSPAMNFLRARLEPSAGLIVAAVTGTPIRLPLPAAVLDGCPGLGRQVGRELVLGIRPEAFRAAEPADATLTADVLVTEALGPDSYVFFELPCPPVVIEERLTADAAGRPAATRVAARLPPHRAPQGRHPLPLAIDPFQLHWFDPATGAAI